MTDDYWSEHGTVFREKPIVTSKQVVYQDGDDARAVSTVAGEDLWVISDALPVALGPKGIWVLRRNHDEAHPDQGKIFNQVQLINAATGKAIVEFTPGWLLGWGGSVAGISEQLAIKIVGDILLLGADGRQESMGSVYELYQAELAIIQHGLISVETAGWDTSKLELELGLDHDHSFSQSATLYDLATGTVDWQTDNLLSVYEYMPNSEVYTDNIMLKLNLPGFLLFDFLTDKLMHEEILIPGPYSPLNRFIGGHMVYLNTLGNTKSPTGFNQADPYLNTSIELPNSRIVEIPDAIVSDDTLLILCTTGATREERWEKDGSWGSDSHLLAIRLDEDGLPVPGKIRVLSKPLDQQQLYLRYMASPDPLEDDNLMLLLNEAGINLFVRTIQRLDQLSEQQLNALPYLAVSFDERYRSQYPNRHSAAELLSVLDAAPNEVEISMYISWLSNPELAPIHNRLRGLLAKAGGDEAAEYLSEYYTRIDGTNPAIQPQPINPPFTIKPQSPKTGDPYRDMFDFTLWAEVVTNDGARYVAYTAKGLINLRDIYLAIDEDNDGIFEDILLTGLTDVHPGYGSEHQQKGSFSLSIEGNQLAITHNAYAPSQDEDLADYLKETEYQEAVLDLGELQKDTDGDGINDYFDPTPNVNAAKMGKVERGIARALDFFYNDEESVTPSGIRHSEEDWGHPWKTLFFTLEGAGPVAYAGSGFSHGICSFDNTQRETYQELFGSQIKESWPLLRGIDFTLPILEQYRATYPWMEDPTEDQLAHFAEGGSRRVIPADYRLEIFYSYQGYEVLLTELNGELYPFYTSLFWGY